MADLVNLNKARKRREREAKAAHSAENRQAFGRSKAEKALEDARKQKVSRDLDQHRLRDPDA